MHFKSTYEVIIIGSGAGAASLIHTITKDGIEPSEILVLERGNKLPRTKSAAFRFINSYENGGVLPCFGRPNIPFGVANCIGGGPEINGSLVWKTPEHIKKDWFENYNLPFSKTIFEKSLNKFDKLLEVKESHIKEDHDYGSFLLKKASNELDILCVPARRALKYSCCSNNLCAFGSPNDSKNTTFNMIIKKLIDRGLLILSGISNIDFKYNKNTGPYNISFKEKGKYKNLMAKKIFLCAGALNSPLLVSKLKKENFSKYRIKFHLNLKSIGLLNDEIPDVPGTMFSAQIQEYAKDNQYIMPFNWHKAHVLSIIDRHNTNLNLDYIYKHGIGLTSQVSNKNVFANMHVITHKSNAFKFLSHSIIKEKNVINSIQEVLERTYALFNELGIDKVFCPILNSKEICLSEAIKETINKPSKLDLLSVHHMGSLPLGGELVDFDGRLKDFPNVYIADASLLPTIVGESPQLTIMAFVSSLYKNKLS